MINVATRGQEVNDHSQSQLAASATSQTFEKTHDDRPVCCVALEEVVFATFNRIKNNTLAAWTGYGDPGLGQQAGVGSLNSSDYEGSMLGAIPRDQIHYSRMGGLVNLKAS